MDAPKRTVFITSFHILISRNILASPAMDLLLADQNIRVVMLVSDRKRKFFERTFVGPRVQVVGIPAITGRVDGYLRYLALASIKSHSLDLKRQTELAGKGAILSRIIAGNRLAHSTIRVLDRFLLRKTGFEKVFEQEKPDLVFATDIQNDFDVRMMHEARRRGIPTVGMVRSWDNLTCKGLVRVIPDVLLVNNEVVAKEAEKFDYIVQEKIKVIGVPHYDRYIEGPAHDRTTFAKSLGMNPQTRFVLYAPTGDRYLAENNTDRSAIEMLSRMIPNGYEVLVRLPPSDTVNLNGLNFPNVRIFRPGQHMSANTKEFKFNELTREDDDCLRDMVAYSELLVSGPSTIVIDASVYDKPIILIGFDGKTEQPYLKSVRHYYDYDHFRPVMDSGGVRLVTSEAELKDALDGYLANPKLDAAGRAIIRERECFKLDGKSSARLVEVLKNTMKI